LYGVSAGIANFYFSALTKGVYVMSKKYGVILLAATLIVLIAVLGSGCRTADLESTEELILDGEGVYIGQIDSQSVEIEVAGQPRAFEIGEGVGLAGIEDGTPVAFTYVEGETRPVLISIEALAPLDEEVVLQGVGFYTGQIDSHSVEIEVGNEFVAFGLGEGVSVAGISDGSRVAFTYIESEQRPVLLSIEVLDEPDESESGVLTGEGILVGYIDARSVEIELNRAFALGDDVSVGNIEDGSLVVFSYTETGQRAILDSIEAVDEPMEGNLLHGTYIGQIDSQSVEIQYFKAFAIGEGTGIEEVSDGSEIVFTYREGPPRPELISVAPR
jgi:hypothetical protein